MQWTRSKCQTCEQGAELSRESVCTDVSETVEMADAPDKRLGDPARLLGALSVDSPGCCKPLSELRLLARCEAQVHDQTGSHS